MAFDLVKLQMLQEALQILKDSYTVINTYSICRSLFESTKTMISFKTPATLMVLVELLPEVISIIDASAWVRYGILLYEGDIPEDQLDLHVAVDAGYLWPTSGAYLADRIKYLERLIEDELSGTYFIQERWDGL